MYFSSLSPFIRRMNHQRHESIKRQREQNGSSKLMLICSANTHNEYVPYIYGGDDNDDGDDDKNSAKFVIIFSG